MSDKTEYKEIDTPPPFHDRALNAAKSYIKFLIKNTSA